MGGYTLVKADRVCRRRDYIAAHRWGQRIKTQHFTVVIYPNNLERPRMGIGISKKIKGAVRRNRIKRLIREFFRLHKAHFPPSNDYIFSVQRLPLRLTYRDLEQELEGLPFNQACLKEPAS